MYRPYGVISFPFPIIIYKKEEILKIKSFTEKKIYLQPTEK